MRHTFDFIKIRLFPIFPLLAPLPHPQGEFLMAYKKLLYGCTKRRGQGDGRNHIWTVAGRHGNPAQTSDRDIYNIYCRYILYIYVHTYTTHPLKHTHTHFGPTSFSGSGNREGIISVTTRFCGIHWRFENLKMLLLHFFFSQFRKQSVTMVTGLC